MSDIFIGPDRATDAERSAVDAVVNAASGPAVVIHSERLIESGQARRSERRHLLLPALHALQHAAGWISPGGINHVADVLQVPPAEAFGVAGFYDMFSTEQPDEVGGVLHICVDAACQISGAAEAIEAAKAAGRRVHTSPCLGQCEAPVGQFLQGLNSPDRVPSMDESSPLPLPQLGDGVSELKLLRRVGVVDPISFASYVAAGGYSALARAFELGAEAVVDEVATSGLMGRGGAAFPTGIKWRGVAGESGQKHVVVNADESEPGTFKDRVLIEYDPFSVIEAATIAGFAVGASKGWIYIRGEYPVATARLVSAIEQARENGFLSDGANEASRFPSSFTFDLEVRRGAGAYICGEETALFNSLEGFRGEPRQKPPFPTTHGLFSQPTVINNPETLVNVLDIVTEGGDAYAAIGTDGSNGTKLFCVSGNVSNPGVVEVPFGATLGDVLAIAGGVEGELATVLLGGAAGSFVGPDSLDMPLTFEATRAAGASLGSGVVMAFNTEVEMGPVVTRIAEFFRNESCGQCVPCRVGTTRQHELLTISGSGSSRSGSPDGKAKLQLLDDMDRAMKDASICGLGHTASTAVRSAIDLGLVEL